MGHFLFVLLHVAALLFGTWGLVITIPLHLIYAAVKGNRQPKSDPEAPTPQTHVRCPHCAELVRREARVCKHCRGSLTPSPLQAAAAPPRFECPHCFHPIRRTDPRCGNCGKKITNVAPVT